jgi:hypothetical protein
MLTESAFPFWLMRSVLAGSLLENLPSRSNPEHDQRPSQVPVRSNAEAAGARAALAKSAERARAAKRDSTAADLLWLSGFGE